MLVCENMDKCNMDVCENGASQNEVCENGASQNEEQLRTALKGASR
jgi:hypothetical protein